MIAQQPINLKTSKNWVLPPRSKPGRKHKTNTKQAALTDLLPDYNNISSLSNNLKLIDHENLELKSHLLSLIKEFKSLKSNVMEQQQQHQQQPSQPTSPFSIEQSPSINSTTSTSTTLTNTTPITHKRSYYEIEMEEFLDFNHYSEDDDNDDDNEEIFSELSRSTTTSTTSDLLYNSK